MFVFVERQGLVPGRGMVFSSFPDLGAALIASALNREGIETKFIEGVNRWLVRLLSDPDKLLYSAGRYDSDTRAGRLRKSFSVLGPSGFRDQVEKTISTFTTNAQNDFFSIELLDRAIGIIEAAHDIFEHEMESMGPTRHPFVIELAEEIASHSPRLAGFSLAGYPEPVTRSVIELLARKHGIPTVGGGWITLGKNIRELEEIRKAWGLDWMAGGPGENTLSMLYEKMADRKIDIPNLVGRKIEKPKMLPTKDPAPLTPLFDQLMDRHYFAPATTLPLSSNTGCYWKKCAFCPQGYNISPYREKNPELLVEIIEQGVIKWGARHYFFVDECISPGFAEKFCRLILKKGIDHVHFASMARPEKRFDRNLLELMASCGFEELLWGIESGNQRVLDLMSKGTRINEIEKVLELSHGAGIANYGFLLVGFPGERRYEAEATLNFAKRHRAWLDGAQLSRFVVYSTSEVGKEPEKFGLKLANKLSSREVNVLQVEKGLHPRKEQDSMYAKFVTNYNQYTNGNYVSFPHRYYASHSLLSLLYKKRSGLQANQT
ncbi:MAG: radical SAM protein [Deltaproteobacteria bacterium]|nr:radical SAM protein [Deltaproteobacteria bacterium]